MKKLTALLLFWFCFLFAKADTFVVTSSADSGPGTLREAITLANANGTAVADLIHFNIPETSFNLRIINLVNELPSLSSNITIDGSTQPGSSYAVTDARICIKKDDYAPSFTMLKIENAHNVKIFGLYLYYGYWQGIFGYPYRSTLLYGIDLVNSYNIEIGAPGKGNVINGMVAGIYSNSDSCRNIIIRSNFIGHGRYYENQDDDIDESVLGVEGCITMAHVKDITIGGSHPDEGNVFGSAGRGINIDSKYETGNGFIKIRNNFFGRGFDKKTLIRVSDFWDSYINIGRSRNNPHGYNEVNPVDYRIELLDNDIPNHVRFHNISDSIIVQRNKFDEDCRSSRDEYKLLCVLCPKGGIIGGEDPLNANSFQKKYFDNSFPSIEILESGPFTILKNVFDCNSVYGSTTNVFHSNQSVPFVQVDITTPDSVVGRATPNTRIDLYYDDSCTACEGRVYIDNVMADTAGRWKYSAPIRGTIVATATSSIGSTSGFSKPTFNTDSMKVQQPTCGKNNGSITGITTEGAETYYWMRILSPQKTDTVVSHTIDLLNADPGMYRLFAVHGGTCISMGQTIVLEDRTPWIQTSWANIGHPSCGRFNGYIGELTVYNGQYSTYKWIDNQGQTIGTENHINALAPGTYRFVVTDTLASGGCSDTATFVLTNQSGPTLHTDSIRITNAVCSRNGSITNIHTSGVTADPFISWFDSLNNSVGQGLDLLNVPPGKYYLKFKDASACDTIITPYYTIGNTGEITIDTSGKIVAPGNCSGNTGSIQNITVTGGSTYQWKNAITGVIVGNTLPVSGLAAGTYQLTVTNTHGCSETSPVIGVPAPAFLPIAVTAWGNRDANCGQPNGIIEAQQFSKDPGSYTFQWVDSTTGQIAGSATRLQNIYGGTFLLFATDSNGCRQQVATASIANLPLPYFDYSALQIIPDQCLTSQGAIRGLVVKDMRGTGNFLWLNSSDDPVGNTLNIQNLQQGTYRLKATDQVGCSVTSNPLTVDNINTPLSPPQYDDQTILKNTSATLMVKNNRAGTYLLYDDPLATVPVGENPTGIFTTPLLHADKVYYIRFVNGVCQSNLVSVHVKVVDKAAIYVPTAFTPNGDGRNDLLKAIPYGRIRLLNFSVYNRWGQLVFSTGSFNTGWNGRVNGKPVDTGVFVWMIKAVDEITGQSMEQKGSVLLIQ